MEEGNLNGARQDPRTEEERVLDHTHQEYLGGSVQAPYTVWEPKTSWITLDIRRQIISTSCGAQSFAKAITAFTGIIASALPIFDSRSNFPGQGMYMQEVGSLGVKIGTDTETKYPSENMTDNQLNSLEKVFTGMPYKIGSYYNLPAGADTDMELIAQALEKGHALMFGINSNLEEWTAIPTITGLPSTFSHFVCCHSKNYLIWNTEKSVVIDDSCNLSTTYNLTGQRILTETFIKARTFGILAFVPITTQIASIPHCSLSQDLSYGMMNNPEVVNLQDMLKVNGCMDMSIPSTGNFLQATKQAVMKFQTKYASDILTPNGLTAPTGFVGSSTIAKFKVLYP